MPVTRVLAMVTVASLVMKKMILSKVQNQDFKNKTNYGNKKK
jgi:hypothetical protein